MRLHTKRKYRVNVDRCPNCQKAVTTNYWHHDRPEALVSNFIDINRFFIFTFVKVHSARVTVLDLCYIFVDCIVSKIIYKFLDLDQLLLQVTLTYKNM